MSESVAAREQRIGFQCRGVDNCIRKLSALSETVSGYTSTLVTMSSTGETSTKIGELLAAYAELQTAFQQLIRSTIRMARGAREAFVDAERASAASFEEG